MFPLPRVALAGVFLLSASALPASADDRTPGPSEPTLYATHPKAAAVMAASGGEYSITGIAGAPTDEETLALEYINRARANPAAEGTRLRNATDPDVVAAYSNFSVDLALMESQFQAIAATSPLAFNAALLNDARQHSQDQFDHAYQGHTGSDGSNLGDRALAAGYNYTQIAENVYAYSKSIVYSHAGFEVDWGTGTGGMQTPPGHRENIHNATAREIGVGVIDGSNTVNGSTVGPQIVTHEIGTSASGGIFLTGVVYFDLSGDNFYSIGEGLGGVTVTVSGDTSYAVSVPSGAYTVPLPHAGTYTVTFSGLGLSHTATVTTSGENVKVDYVPTYQVPAVSGPSTASVGAAAMYTFSSVPGASGYSLHTYQRASSTAENAESTANVTAVVSNYTPLSTDTKAQGTASFHLYHPEAADQYLTLNRTLYIRPNAQLTFASRLGWASNVEYARLQVSTDDGTTWTDLYQQQGTGSAGETSFVTRNVDLAAYAGDRLRVRFAYTMSNGSYYPAADPGVGWYVDAIGFTNTDDLLGDTTTDLATATAFTFTPSAAGDFALLVIPRNQTRALPANTFTLVTAAMSNTTPTITTQPVSIGVTLGATATLSVTASGTGTLTYQWAKDGQAIAGATNATLTIASVAASDLGSYTVTVTNSAGSVVSSATTLSLNTAYLSNLSVRAKMAAGQTLIVGFTVADATENVLVRGVGPGLAYALPQYFSTSTVMANPRLTYYSGSTAANTNDSWDPALATTFNSLGAFPFQSGSADAAFVLPITGSGNTVWLQGTGPGIALVEAYAMASSISPRLVNLSARNRVGTGTDILIAGFSIAGTGTKKLLIRAVGPGLPSSVPDRLSDPKLELYDTSGSGVPIATNDNWDASLSTTFDQVYAFPLTAGSHDAALLVTLQAGQSYTAQVKGVNDTTGEALVEVYEVP